MHSHSLRPCSKEPSPVMTQFQTYLQEINFKPPPAAERIVQFGKHKGLRPPQISHDYNHPYMYA
eukprot:5945207-Amphidinium_carterae.1